MRTAARAYFENVLSWQKDEERALLLPTLFGLTGGTSFYGATAHPLVGGGWKLCWFGRLLPDVDDWFRQCIEVDNPNVGQVYIPCFPEAPYEKEWFVSFAEIGSGECDCLSGFPQKATWEPTYYPWGQWHAQWKTCGDADIHLYITPTSCDETGVLWDITLTQDGEVIYSGVGALHGGGVLPTGHLVTLSAESVCPDVTLSLIVEDF